MRNQELKRLLTLSRWDQLAPSAQEEAASALAASLPERFRFAGLETHALGQLRHRVACFTWNEARFALLPGGLATLGYAPGSFHPSEAHQRSWEESCREYPEIALKYPTLESYLEQQLTSFRQVTIQPFLLEVVAQKVSLRREIDRRRYPALTYPLSAVQLQEYVAPDGFRLPTSDEWEYACAAGARTLWRWGDETTMILMDMRSNPAPAWDLHLRPNAFGLLIGTHPANWECTAEWQVMRGGDGGTALNVLPGRFLEWLTLASAFRRQVGPRAKVSLVYLRRAYSLVGEAEQEADVPLL